MPILGTVASAISGNLDSSAYFPIAITTLATSTASITFSSIPATYKHLQVRALIRTDRATTYDYPAIRFNSDSGANYVVHYMEGNGSTVSQGTQTGMTYIGLNEIAGGNATANIFGVSILDILDYTNTNKNTTTRVLGGYNLNGTGVMTLRSGLWLNTAAITTLTIIPATGPNFVQYSAFTLYGITG